MPVWISSKTSSAPASSHASRAATQHLVGDREDARLALDRLDHHRRGPLADRGPQRVGSSRGTATKPGGSGPKRSSRASRGVAASVPSVRPWKAPVEDDDLGLVDAAARARAFGPA